MMDLFDYLCSVMKKKSVYILLVSLLIISGAYGQGNLEITLSTNPGVVYSMLPSSINTADVTILTQNVTLQANMEGRWEKSGETISTTNKITFDVITRNLAGLYEFLIVEDTLAIQIKISVTGVNMAEFTPEGEYNILSGNEVFNTNTTLACATSGASEPLWKYKIVRTDSYINQSSVTWNSTTGISTITITTTQQGYYTCTLVAGGTTYTVAIFNPDVTIIATNEQKYTYTKDIDPPDIQLLCTTTDSSTALSDIKWTPLNNPLVLNFADNQDATTVCNIVSTSTMILSVNLVIQGPPEITLSTELGTTYTKLSLSGDSNRVDIDIFSRNVILQSNLKGNWILPDGSQITGESIHFELFTKNLAGVYEFYVTSWRGTKVLAIQIQTTAVGGNFAVLTSPDQYNIISGNEVFNTSTTLACATSGTSKPLWKYKEVQTDSYFNQSSTTWNSTTGISTLTINTTQQGYYTCTPIAGGATYAVAIFNPNVTIKVTSQVIKAFTRGIDSSQLQLLCRSSDTNIPLDDIQWTSKFDASLSIPNPFIVSELSNGYNYLRCNRGSTPFDYSIIVQGPPTLTITDASSTSYTLLPPENNTANITVFSQNILLEVNLATQNSLGRWVTPLDPEITTSSTTISEFTANLAGLYTFYVINLLGSEELAIQIQISAIGSNFAELTPSDKYSLLTGNNIFYTDTTLVCVTSDTNEEPVWSYRETQQGVDTTPTSVNWDDSTGISRLDIVTTEQGYYTCTITGVQSYNVAIFNSDVTVEVTSQVLKAFTRGIDSSQLQLLCISSDTNVPLDDIQWISRLDTSLSIPNPFIVSTLSNGNHYLRCNNGNTSFNYIIIVQGPPTLTITDTSSTSHTLLPPENNTANITIFNQNILLEVNLVTQDSLGRWETPLIPEITATSTTISKFTANLTGLYTFYVINFLGNEELAIQIQITAIGSNFAELTSSDEYTLLSGNNIFYTDTTLVCVTSDTSIQPVWTYRKTQLVADTTLTDAIWDDSTGISRLDIVTTQQGYYTCTVTGVQSYSVAIFNPDVTTNATDGQQYTYTRNIDSPDIQLLCTSDSNTSLSSIRWDTFPNPLILQFAQIQENTIICRVESSIILMVDLLVQGPPQITLSTTSDTYSELPNSGNANTAEITILSKNVMLQVNIKGKWEFPDGSSNTESVIEFELFTKDLAGMYKFNVSSWDGSEVLAIQIGISAGGNFAELTSPDKYNILSGNEVFNTSTMLACTTSSSSEPSWKYKVVRTNTYSSQSSTTWDSTTGISTLTITTTKQGYYTCTITGVQSYTVAIFNFDVTVEVTSTDIKVFTRGIDSSQLQLLCRSYDTNIPLDDIQWTSILDISLSIPNPFIVNTSDNGYNYLRCNRDSDTSFNYIIYVQGPPTLTITDASSTSYTLLPPENNTADITIFSQNILLEVNLITQYSLGRWVTPLDPEITTTSTTISEFTANLAGLYTFYVINFLGNEELAIQIQITAVGTAIGIENNFTITPISSNIILYNEIATLVAASAKIQLEASDVEWSYQESVTGNTSEIFGTSIDSNRSISRLDLNNMADGYYSVSIKDNNSNIVEYIVGIFNDKIIYDTTVYKTIKYTSGIDSNELQILCIPPDDNSGLENIKWINGSTKFPNPVPLERVVKELNITGLLLLTCVDKNNEVYQITVMNQDLPIITLTYNDIESRTSGVKGEEIFYRHVPVFTPNVQLGCNKDFCRWTRDNRALNNTSINYTIRYLTINDDGVYILETQDNTGTFRKSLKIDLTAVGTAFLTVDDGTYEELQNNSIINMTNTTMLACATSNKGNTQDRVSWYFQENSTSPSKKETSELNDTTGLSVFEANKTGYYHCYVKDHKGDIVRYSVGLIELSEHTILIRREDFMNSEPRSFTRGEPLQYYYQDENIPITAIRWGIDPSDDEDTDREFHNPVSINDVFNRFGSGAIQLSCFYRQSPLNTVGYISIDMKDNESLTIEYEGILTTFSDLTNHNFPVAETITIQILSKNVKFSCSLSSCEVIEGNSNTPINLVIDTIRIEHNGTYSLSMVTKTGTSYTTAAFTLNVTGFIKQNITNVYSSVINANSANITWDLLTDDLPENADQLFNITYQIDGGEEMFAGNTQDAFFYIPDLTAGVTYTVWVELSYTYTIVKDKMSIQVVIPGIELILIIIIVVVVLILLLVAIAVILLILCIWKFRGKSNKKFQALKSDENELQMKPPARSSRDFQYSPISPRIDNLAYNPVLTESLPKFNQSASRDSRNYQNLTDVKDPRVKPIPLEMYKKTINKLWEDENALEDEYKSLGGEILRYECRNAQFDQNRIKNKYKFIYPYDKSRVVLKKIEKDVHSDYINASHIPGTYVTENFIAAQGPKVNTIQDVWRMVFEQNIRNIVMVTNCIEGGKLKCEEYFPSKDGKTNEYGQYKVKTVSMTQDVGHITRVLKIQPPTESIQVKHFHFTAWPDHDVPSLHDELLQFIGYVQDNITQSEAPILVHCSAGVGRTGTFITLFNLRAEILKRQPISIYHLVNEMREHRPHMVQTFRQYKFIYLAVLELMLDNTSILADEFSNTYQNYLKSDQTGYVSVFYQQFSELNYQCEKSFEYATDNGEDNEEKNPIPHILPYDNNRVVIYSPHFECGYINASYHENNLFITTLHPTANTLLDFLQMIYQTDATLVVMLSTAKEKAKIQGNMSERKAYWPNKDVPLEVPPFQVEVVNSEKSTAMVKQKIILRNLQESSEREFTQVISTSWTDRSDLTDLLSVLVLLHLILKHRLEYPNGTIIMHCADSISKTGVVFTVYQCIQEMERTGKVDIFHTVKRLRRERMKLIPDLAQFLACFSLMNEYCSSK